MDIRSSKSMKWCVRLAHYRKSVGRWSISQWISTEKTSTKIQLWYALAFLKMVVSSISAILSDHSTNMLFLNFWPNLKKRLVITKYAYIWTNSEFIQHIPLRKRSQISDGQVCWTLAIIRMGMGSNTFSERWSITSKN